MKRQITFTLSGHDIAEAQKAHAQRRKLSSGTVLHLFLLWAGASLFVSGAAVFIHAQGWWSVNPFYVVFFCLAYLVIVLAIYAISRFIILPKRIKSAVEKNRYAGLEQTMIWDDKALAFHSEWMKGSYPWRMIRKADEFPDFLALYLSQERFNIIPKNALDTQQLEDLRTIIRREINRTDTL